MTGAPGSKTRSNGRGTEVSAAVASNGDGLARRLMTAGEVAELLGVPVSWVYEQSRLGRIPTVTLGRYRRYRFDAIEAWIERIEASAPSGRASARHTA
jgi:excisionase family DNA binding protein